ncbi:MAG: hypothetical protein ACOYKE_12925 [Ferruginibacter sp.]
MLKKLLLSGVFYLMFVSLKAQQGVAIAPVSTIPNPAAMLDVISTNKGLLIPRLTTAQRTAIASVPDGLMVYDSTIKKFMYFNQSEAAWKLLGSDTLQMPFRKTFSINSGGGIGYEPGSAIFSITNNGSSAAALFRQKQAVSNSRGNALYAEYDGNNFQSGYNSAFAAYGLKGRYTVGISAYSDSTAAIATYNLYRGTAIMAQNSVNFGGGPFAGIASGIFNSNKTLDGFACGIYQDGIESSPIIFSFANAAISGYSEAGAGGKFFGTDTALHAIGNTYLFGNLKLVNGTQGNGKILKSDAGGTASWAANIKSDILNISAAAFRPVSGNNAPADYVLDATALTPYNDITITNTTTGSPLVATVQLPNGANITGMNFYAYDNNSSIGLKADFISTPINGTGNNILLSANSGAVFASGTFYSGFAGVGAPATIDNNFNSYLIKIYPVDIGGNNINWGSLLYIKGLTITYNYKPVE